MTRHQAARWVGFVALWVFIGLALSIEVYFNLRVTMPSAANFWNVTQAQFGRALVWAVMAPIVLWLRHAVPLKSGRWVGGVTFHLAISFLFMFAYFFVRMVLSGPIESWESFWEMSKRSFYGRNLIDVLYYWTVIGVAYALRTRESYEREILRAAQLEARLIEAELKALKHQLNPHFLFNTMNTISVLVREQRNDDAVQLIARLSSLLRMSLENTRVQTVTLRQELEFLHRYLEIQKARFGEKLQFKTDTEAAALDAVIPNLILQPAVENAILHGIAQKTTHGTVQISARVRDARLEVEVRDDGPGFDISSSGPPKEGIGLTNTRVRLSRHYGKEYQMVLKSERGQGVSVNIVLPFRAEAISNPESI